MTCIVAYKGSKEVIVGADSQTTIGNMKVTKDKPKWVRFPKFAICCAGAVIYNNFFEYISTEKGLRNVNPNNRQQALRLAFMLRELCKKADLTLKDKEESTYADGHFIIVTRNKIWEMFADFCILEIDTYTSIGSGSSYALGVLDALKGAEDEEALVHDAVKAATLRDTGCGGPIIVRKFSEME